MAADSVLSRELASLRKAAAAAQRERRIPPAASPASGRTTGPAVSADHANAAAAAAAAPAETGEERKPRDQLGELAKHAMQFFADAEKNIAAHPAGSVVAALLLGVFIGRLLGRGQD